MSHHEYQTWLDMGQPMALERQIAGKTMVAIATRPPDLRLLDGLPPDTAIRTCLLDRDDWDRLQLNDLPAEQLSAVVDGWLEAWEQADETQPARAT